MVGRRDPGHLAAREASAMAPSCAIFIKIYAWAMGHTVTAFQGRHGLVRCNPGAVAPSMPDRGTAEVSAQPLKLFASAAMHAAAAAAVQLNEAERNQSRTRHAHHVSRWRKQMRDGVRLRSTPDRSFRRAAVVNPAYGKISTAAKSKQNKACRASNRACQRNKAAKTHQTRQSTQQHTVC